MTDGGLLSDESCPASQEEHGCHCDHWYEDQGCHWCGTQEPNLVVIEMGDDGREKRPVTASDRWHYCTLPVDDGEFDVLEAAYDSMPEQIKGLVRDAEITERVARMHIDKATTAVNDWAKSVLDGSIWPLGREDAHA